MESLAKYWIETSGPPTIDYIGKILVSPADKGYWKNMEKASKGDIVYHYITSKGPEPVRRSFIGKSMVKEPAVQYDLDGMIDYVQSIIGENWDSRWEEFTKDRWEDHETFYIVELENFQRFNPPIPLKALKGVFRPTPMYLRSAPMKLVAMLEKRI